MPLPEVEKNRESPSQWQTTRKQYDIYIHKLSLEKMHQSVKQSVEAKDRWKQMHIFDPYSIDAVSGQLAAQSS
jgi:hypothetical protein